MVFKIAARLQLPPPAKIVKIEDIASQEEIDKAIRTRRIEGKHVIPVPSLEVKRSYPNIFFDAIRILKRRKISSTQSEHDKVPAGIGLVPVLHEKSLVRPVYSKHGRVIISEIALIHLVTHCVDEYNKEIKIKKLHVKNAEMGYRLIITIDVPYGIQLGGMHEMQQYIIDTIERYTGILIEEVNIIIDKVSE